MKMSTINRTNAPELQTITSEAILDVQQRLEQLREWSREWESEDALLEQRAQQLDDRKHIDILRGLQISRLRQRLRMKLVKKPIEISAEAIEKIGYDRLREHLAQQFARLSKDDRMLWLNNFLFILTGDLRSLNDKIARVRSYRSLGQQRNFLLGGASGMGKTTYLDWFTSNYIPKVESERNHVPIIKIDAPVSNHTPKPLFQRMILECGMAYLKGDNEEDLLMKLALYFQKCGTEMLIVDEVEHIVRPEIRRRLLEISNMTRGIAIVCASCNPHNLVEGDVEFAGRWNDYFELRSYTGERLSELLVFIELMLPFTRPSSLAVSEIRTGANTRTDGLAKLIEERTGGILRDIMILIREASARAVENDLPCLSPSLLDKTWREIQTNRVSDSFGRRLPEGMKPDYS
jgi:hypothetical protein